VTGCGGNAGSDGAPDLADVGRDAIPPLDHGDLPLPPPPLPVGSACRIAAQCGSNGVCASTFDGFPNGYCTTGCEQDGDCGNGHICTGLDKILRDDTRIRPQQCFVGCTSSADCRTDGYACVLATPGIGVCAPDEPTRGVCDPTAGDGTCTTALGGPGACIRYRTGSGNAGTCETACTLGSGTCLPIKSQPGECIVIDQRNGGVASSGAFGDKYVGGVCQQVNNIISRDDGNVVAVAEGEECLFAIDSLPPLHFDNICVDGSQCDIRADGIRYLTIRSFVSTPVTDPTGDNRCHPLCYPDGPPDGGVIPDGGSVATPCDGICKPLWGNDVNLGLCVPNPPAMAEVSFDAGSASY
jgi:hypothetical protein